MKNVKSFLKLFPLSTKQVMVREDLVKWQKSKIRGLVGKAHGDHTRERETINYL